jgi:AraC family transcriptional regulator, L-rhamnose operon transcriptional activator RhaR
LITLTSEFYFSDMPFFINKYSYDNYEDIALHKHDFIEIAFVYNGRGIHIINNRKFEVAQGDLFIINTETPHSFYPIDETNSGMLKVYNCMFNTEFIKNLDVEIPILREITQIFLYKSLYEEEHEFDVDLKLTAAQQADIMLIFEKMYVEYSTKQKGYTSILKLLLPELLIKMYRAYKAQHNLSSCSCKSFKHKIILDSIDYLKHNYSKKLKVDDLCNQAFLSKSYFTCLFKSVTGTNVIDYIQRIRIEKACELLINGEHKITEVMELVGYSDYRFFNKSFKKVTGLTANMYKKKHTKPDEQSFETDES